MSYPRSRAERMDKDFRTKISVIYHNHLPLILQNGIYREDLVRDIITAFATCSFIEHRNGHTRIFLQYPLVARTSSGYMRMDVGQKTAFLNTGEIKYRIVKECETCFEFMNECVLPEVKYWLTQYPDIEIMLKMIRKSKNMNLDLELSHIILPLFIVDIGSYRHKYITELEYINL